MNEIAFFDTNILLYMHDVRDQAKYDIARATFRTHLEKGLLVISTQVVQEFYSAAKRLHMAASDAAVEAEALCGLPMIANGRIEIVRAMAIERRYQLSFWDALILAAAETAEASTLFTEDLTHGQWIGSVKVVNPFRTLAS
jgi:predicted nucleic acid-binding protein